MVRLDLERAGGGPGELYKTSVYPKGQLGIHGLAFEAGLVGANLTESQFGLYTELPNDGVKVSISADVPSTQPKQWEKGTGIQMRSCAVSLWH